MHTIKNKIKTLTKEDMYPRVGIPATRTLECILNPPTSAKPFKLQNLFVTLVNIDIFYIALKFILFTVD